MSIRRATAYLGLVLGVSLLIWAGVMRYPLQQSSSEGQGVSQQTISISGYGIVREAARDGLVRDKQGRLVKRDQNTKKDANTCYT